MVPSRARGFDTHTRRHQNNCTPYERKQKTVTKDSRKAIRRIASGLMLASEAHYTAHVLCYRHLSNAKPPNIERLTFQAVSLELLLLSIEQALKLMLYLQDGMNRTTHDVLKLYTRARRYGKQRPGVWDRLTGTVETLVQKHDLESIVDNDIHSCIQKHKASYDLARYMQFGHARGSQHWSVTKRDFEILECLAVALLRINGSSVGAAGIPYPPSLKRVPIENLTPEQRARIERDFDVQL